MAKKECDLFGIDLLAREHDVATAMEEHHFRPVSFILAEDGGVSYQLVSSHQA